MPGSSTVAELVGVLDVVLIPGLSLLTVTGSSFTVMFMTGLFRIVPIGSGEAEGDTDDEIELLGDSEALELALGETLALGDID